MYDFVQFCEGKCIFLSGCHNFCSFSTLKEKLKVEKKKENKQNERKNGKLEDGKV